MRKSLIQSLNRSQQALAASLLALLLWSTGAAAQESEPAQEEFLDPEVAFVLSVTQEAQQLTMHWYVEHGYKLYKDKINIQLPGTDTSVIVMPPAISFFDENFGETMEAYKAPMQLTLPITAIAEQTTLTIGYQGCADAGLCYPPITKQFTLQPGYEGLVAPAATNSLFGAPASTPLLVPTATPAATPATSSVTAAAAPTSAAVDETSVATRMLQSSNLWTIGGGFLLFGLLLSFTPCVLPMVPILSSIIVGMDNGAQRSRWHGFSLSVAYCLGMALVYTGMGVAAGLLGEGLAAYLQAPWLLLTFATLLVVFSLSMFDVYQLQLPQALQGKLDGVSGGFQGGRYASVFLLGAVSSLIVGPCVAAPLAGALIYISQTGDVMLGAIALFSMAMGMSVPLLLTGLSAGSLLPRAGTWMVQIKVVFGILLLAVAIWMVTPVLPTQPIMLLWGALAILSAMYLGVFDGPSTRSDFTSRIRATFSVLLLIVGLSEVIGAVSGSGDPLRPLALASSGAAPREADNAPQFTRIASLADLQQQLDIAATTGTPVMLDFYADWCVACKEMERFTFSNPQVTATMGKFTLLQADVTANNADDRALMKAFNLYGPPGIILFDSSSTEEAPHSRIIGFTPADRFLAAINPLTL
ncbi:MAG: protein-disulfide reductase DsbD [Gammaproteobacteria bacterium]|nr:protein-disulfide reductase DsbD [Gammaproteobacteria bacterium]